MHNGMERWCLIGGVTVFVGSVGAPVVAPAPETHFLPAIQWTISANSGASASHREADRKDQRRCSATPAEIAIQVREVSNREGLPSKLLNRIVQLESGFQPCVVSPSGALGLMQLMPSTLQELEVDDAFDPVQNLTAGARFIKKLVSQFDGDWTLALSAYNAGPAAVEFYNGVPPYQETIRFVNDILGNVETPGFAEVP